MKGTFLEGGGSRVLLGRRYNIIVHLVEVAHALLVLDLRNDLHLRRDDDAAHTDRKPTRCDCCGCASAHTSDAHE